MDRLREMEVFVAVAESGGFAKAARALQLSPPAITRAVAGLEARLGVRLLNRTTRSLSLTEPGRRFLASARRLLGELEAAERDAAGEAAQPRGHLSVTASATFGRAALTPVVLAFLAAHPQVRVSALLVDRVVNLVEEGLDLAVRIGPLPDSSLIARRLGAVRRLLVASPGYLAAHGRPDTPADLARHSLIGFTGLMPNQRWHYQAASRPQQVAVVPRFEVNDALAALAAAEQGQGITLGLSYMLAEPIRAGRLVPVLEPFAPPPVPVHLVYPQSGLVAPKLRAFVDFAAPRLQARLAALALSDPD